MSSNRTKDLAGANAVELWDDAHRFSPAPRHRRRLLLDWIGGLRFAECLDAGCAQPYLIEQILSSGSAEAFGCDISDEVIRQNRVRFPRALFEPLDLSRQTWPGGRQFDLVVCSEVLEHIERWEDAVANLAAMCRRYLLITVPSGRIHPVDRHVGHLRHFRGDEISALLRCSGLGIVRLRRWGFPFHSLYKHAVNGIAPDAVYTAFGEGRYGWGKRLICQALYLMFFANDLFRSGQQLLILAERDPRAGTEVIEP